VDPLVFGATGGGESFAARCYLVNHPPYPQARLDLDSFSSSGSSYITTDLAPFGSLAADDNPVNGYAFNSFLSFPGQVVPGTYAKTFYTNFSDEDLPGANSPGSYQTELTVSFALTLIGGGALAMWIRNRSRRGSMRTLQTSDVSTVGR
jgi:hypothetical protein